jgi:hypothetical protein
VLLGLVVGIALIVVLSGIFKPSLDLSDEQIKARLKIIPEIKAFQAKAAEYHVQPTEITEERDRNSVYMLYVAVNQHYYEDGDPDVFKNLTIAKELRLYVALHSAGDYNMRLKCVKNYPVDGQIQDLNATVDEIRNTKCLELGDLSAVLK